MLEGVWTLHGAEDVRVWVGKCVWKDYSDVPRPFPECLGGKALEENGHAVLFLSVEITSTSTRCPVFPGPAKGRVLELPGEDADDRYSD